MNIPTYRKTGGGGSCGGVGARRPQRRRRQEQVGGGGSMAAVSSGGRPPGGGGEAAASPVAGQKGYGGEKERKRRRRRRKEGEREMGKPTAADDGRTRRRMAADSDSSFTGSELRAVRDDVRWRGRAGGYYYSNHDGRRRRRGSREIEATAGSGVEFGATVFDFWSDAIRDSPPQIDEESTRSGSERKRRRPVLLMLGLDFFSLGSSWVIINLKEK